MYGHVIEIDGNRSWKDVQKVPNERAGQLVLHRIRFSKILIFKTEQYACGHG